ncbi:prolyl oligopeptidase family protein [Salegentibacter sp. 24]|uniref:carboxylesterase family protein n=1 Tax=Salegentibacter sp. 24 TaxID=2183986 RepID=UPI00105D8D48|nr:alpha/beta fold hydrolase [Salegentibacter sp. 24]TDN95033.1 prolyl oligopeptidase family protein [Salegentibacter sp. 24]
MHLLRITLFTLFFLLVDFINAQQREGNIVAYFGKEKVDEISEGEVVHLFKKGLILSTSGIPFSKAAVTHDLIFSNAVANGLKITKDKKEYDGFLGETVSWKPIRVNKSSEFKDPNLQNTGYLYLEYESASEKTVLFEASGHSSVLINGLPHAGDHYDFGWSLIPVKLKKGKNQFLLSGGRFSHIRARLLAPHKPVEFTTRDLTLPDLLIENDTPLWGAIRIINSEDNWLKDAKIRIEIGGTSAETILPAIAPEHVKKVPFSIPVPKNLKASEKVQAILYLKDKRNHIIDTTTIDLAVKSKYKHHKNTFVSDIDRSVQYYSLAPSLNRDRDNQALFLSVHGASVEAVNQANAYKQKEWGHIVAPTNRRPFGFAWEDWGRLDALEVLKHSEELLKTDPQRTYLTGHSMGGHGTWYLGATYPDKFAAIAPAAGYPDLLEYRNSFIRRLSEDQIQQDYGMSKTEFVKKTTQDLSDAKEIRLDQIIRRAGNPSRTLKLENNYLHFGVYILHGDSDRVVPTFFARQMRARLGEFHNDFAYYEYPGGKHWFGDESVDWPPIFYFFNRRKIKADHQIDKINFTTASPGVSAGSHFIAILQQEIPFEISNFDFEKTQSGFKLRTTNVLSLAIATKAIDSIKLADIQIDDQSLLIPEVDTIYLKKQQGKWQVSQRPSVFEKNPLRNGGFKDAFRNNVVLVYATGGSRAENQWYYNRAKFDAEKFYYRANGSLDIIKDTDFKAADFKDRNVVIYGNKSNNAAWLKLLKNAPVQVSDNKIKIGEKELLGDHLGTYFIYPRMDSERASIGVVSATGIKGMHAGYANEYLENGSFFPDLIIFDDTLGTEGLKGVRAAGFFGNDWSVENGDFIWN